MVPAKKCLKQETKITIQRRQIDYNNLKTIEEQMAILEHPVYRACVEVEFETWAKPQLLQGEEFLMQWLAGWNMIQSLHSGGEKRTSSYHKQAASP